MSYGLPGGSNIVTGVWCLEVTAHLVMSWDLSSQLGGPGVCKWSAPQWVWQGTYSEGYVIPGIGQACLVRG